MPLLCYDCNRQTQSKLEDENKANNDEKKSDGKKIRKQKAYNMVV